MLYWAVPLLWQVCIFTRSFIVSSESALSEPEQKAHSNTRDLSAEAILSSYLVLPNDVNFLVLFVWVGPFLLLFGFNYLIQGGNKEFHSGWQIPYMVDLTLPFLLIEVPTGWCSRLLESRPSKLNLPSCHSYHIFFISYPFCLVMCYYFCLASGMLDRWMYRFLEAVTKPNARSVFR